MCVESILIKHFIIIDRIFAVGGYGDGNNYLNTGEYYTPNTDTWTMIRNMKYKRDGPGEILVFEV